MTLRPLKLRRPDTCVTCARSLPAGVAAFWDAAARTVACAECGDTTASPEAQPTIFPGQAGSSAAREHERRKRNREQRVRDRHPRTAGLRLALQSDPQHELAWRRGQLGEEAVAESLEWRTADGAAVLLHDRRTPGSRANIDHLAICPAGVYVIDAKAWNGKVTAPKPWFGQQRLLIAGRDRTALIDGLDRQVAVVRATLATHGDDVAVRGVLCFTKAELPVLGTLTMREHLLLYRKGLAKRINQGGPLGTDAIQQIAQHLSEQLPPA